MDDHVLVVLFLRGGMDGLNLISPAGEPEFIAARPEELRVARQGDAAGIPLSNPAADVDFRFHPQARGLSELYEAGEMAVIHASGLVHGTRSHFEAEDRMERAAPKGGAGAGGWLGRWLTAVQPQGVLPALAVGHMTPGSLRGSTDVAVAGTLEDLTLQGSDEERAILASRLQTGFGVHPLMQAPARRLVSLSQVLSDRLFDAGESGAGADYPENELADMLRPVAQAIRMGLGLRVATVDFGGWDTHEDQADSFTGLVAALSSSLTAFWRDLGPARARTTVLVQSEFGRRLRANGQRGTDHGHGNAMLVLGGGVLGGRMLGRWPGLENAALDDGADLAITTDYRHVLAEILVAKFGASGVAAALPGFAHEPMGLFA